MPAARECQSSIEGHARRFRRYHPVIISQVVRLHRDVPGFPSLFTSPRDLSLFVSAISRATVVISTRSALKSGRRAPGSRKNACVEFHHHFPRRLVAMLGGDVAATRRFLRASVGLARARRPARGPASAGGPRASGLPRVTVTPCYMLANRATWAAGVLNKPGRRAGNTFDLTTIEGFVYLMHEIYHTMQWFRSPPRLLVQYVRGVVHSLARSDGHIAWAHELIDFEVEAIAFHERLWLLLDAWSGTGAFLSTFRSFQ